jgi:hypothetical protein
MGRGSDPGLELTVRAVERGRAVREEGKAEERESEGEVVVGWDRPDGGTRWQREKEDGAAAGGQPRGGAQLAGMEREKGQLPCGAAGFK